ncbi:MAG TPA: AMP-binding protein [Myxococcota bacterium]|nr:AMP-binding protein [Myxococcota bacterium]HRY92998.1 AMP-binding protein [Myxococcota bacterium]HSA21310.1 AMP-binding protein [Myxococcota bacterium]
MSDPKPWLKYYAGIPEHLDYPDATLYDCLRRTAERVPDAPAWDFFGARQTYREFLAEVDRVAAALHAAGLREGARITISMPTTPQGVICFYAANRLGAVCSMIHPLSPPKEIAFYLKVSGSTHALTLDAFYPAFREGMQGSQVECLILARIPDYLPWLKGLGFRLTKGRKIKPVPPDPRVRWWHELARGRYPAPPPARMGTHDTAVIMYSGGTTGTPKGILLSNRNFIAEGMQAVSWVSMSDGDSMLAILPIFHGFGLGVCINAVVLGGGKSILVPQFTAKTVAELIKQKRPSFVVGVPTLYEALTREPAFLSADLSCLRGAFCGADHLPRPVKERFEELVRKSGGDLKLLEGYGLTEAVTAIMCMPLGEYRECSIGIPFPDMLAKVVRVGSTDEVPVGEEGEICVSGPAVMQGYLDKPEETAAALRTHADGRVWLHTGDLASMDRDGFFYFKLRLKRMIKSSGMNVYPVQVEEVLLAHPAVAQACVIGVPDKAQIERVKAFVVLNQPEQAGPELERALIAHCQEQLIKWACPRAIEFRPDLPKTLVGKVNFRQLQDEELARMQARGEWVGEKVC